jgi:Glycosyltransferase family 87
MRWRAVLLLLLVAAATEFMVRGPLRLRHGTEWNDFLSPYIQSGLWIQGADPYAAKNLVKHWPARKPMFTFVMRDAADGSLVAKRGVPSPYPITSFVVLSPLALLSWNMAQFVWIVLSVGAVAIMICSVVAMAGVSWREPKAWIFAAFTLALAPIHTGLVTENPAVLVVALCVATVWVAEHSRENLAALLLALTVCLKPQVGICFLLFFLLQRRWRIAWVASGLCSFIALIAISRMSIAGTPWLFTYINNSRQAFSSGAINDFSEANPVWFHMLNLQVALDPLPGKVSSSNFGALAVGVVLMCGWLRLGLKSGRHSTPLLSLSTLVVISLLPIYHRSYDAALLVLPLGWALLQGMQQTAAPRSTLGLIALFLTPGAALVNQIAERAHMSATITHTWWWRSFIVAHQVWALLLLSTLLLWTMAKSSAVPSSEEIDMRTPAEFAASSSS